MGTAAVQALDQIQRWVSTMWWTNLTIEE
jgi:hypothetical protein